MNSVFTTSFIASVQSALDENCPVGTGQCVTRTKLSEVLGLDSKLRLESALGVLVTSGTVTGYEVRKGPNGGIGRVGEKAAPKPSTPSAPELSDEFKTNLMAALESLCDANGTPVSRQVLADHLGLPKSLPLISAALRTDEFAGFETKIGKGGGVRRVVASVLGEALASSLETATVDEPVAASM